MVRRRFILTAFALTLALPTIVRADKSKDDGVVPAKASVNDKYAKLLRKIEVAEDKATYGDFNDWGYWEGTEWAGHKDLPPGYWVYVAPHWYIWGHVTEKK